MRIRLPDPALLDQLSAHYSRSGFAVSRAGERELEVSRPDAPDEAQGRREIETHLVVWGLLHPETPADVVG